MTIKIVVTPEKYDEIFTLDEVMYIEEMTIKQAYEKITQCVVGEDGEYLTPKQARAVFAGYKPSELKELVKQFFQAIRDSAVNPTSGSS